MTSVEWLQATTGLPTLPARALSNANDAAFVRPPSEC
jgi:hypothetical protein